MTDAQTLQFLAKEFPTADAVSAEIINLSAILELPKGTEYFFSDIHGEADAFAYLLGTASGVIRSKIEALFQNSVPEPERELLSSLIYRPEEVLATQGDDADWCRITIFRLVQVCKSVASKYTRSKVRKKMPAQFGYVLDELLHADTEENKEDYYTAIIAAITQTGVARKFIVALCRLIRQCSIDQLHVLGDIFDRGPHADIVMEELAMFGDVDVEWGNHDIHWMGAVCGNEACIANVVRLAVSYNNFDLLEDSYGINLRPLSSFAAQTYKDDPCLPFQPHILDDNIYDPIDANLAAKMHKAIAVIQFKLEAQLIARHPEYNMDGRALLRFVDFEKGEVEIGGKRYPLRDTRFPTIDAKDPLRLCAEEEEVMHAFRRSFTNAALLGRHIRYLYNNGSMYKIANGNLLYHGCVPMDDAGNFLAVMLDGKKLSGREYLDAIDAKIRTAYFAAEGSAARASAGDYMWYLWCGRHSPLFGKSCMTTFERYFVEDKATHAEEQDPYYKHVQHREACEKILREFGLAPATSHIINGHVPVRQPKGESPVRGGGLLFVIDGGISKAYHGRTGIGGYTLIANSHNLALAEHPPFEDVKNSNFGATPKVRMVERFARRVTVRQTDTGRQLQKDIEQLSELLAAYQDGKLQEKE